MGKSNRKGHRDEPGVGSENRQNHRSGSERCSDAKGVSAKPRSFAAQAAHRASAGPMRDKREKRLGSKRERVERNGSFDERED